ncbi:MAG: alginate export family protein [Hyphomonadaceae bacterium]
MRKQVVGVLGAAAALTGVAHAEEADSIGAAIEGGKLILEARPRVERLDQAGVAEADAYTLRTRLGWETASWNGLTGLIEFEDVRDLGGDYNDGVPPAEPYASIPDPEGTELNRLQLSWRANEHFTGTLGRQTIEFDDKRFVDASNSRQDARTLDALRGDIRFGGFQATYAYVDHVNNTTAEFADWESESHLFNASQTFSPALKLTGFVYALDFETPAAINQSSRFAGVRASGRVEAAGARFDYAASFANQTDYGNSTLSFDLDYWQASVVARRGEWSTRVWYESLEGNGALGFFVPIGSNNNFHGWAGAFSTKPANGLNDFNVTLSYAPEWAPDVLEDLTFMARWYEFETERTGLDLGNELDLSVSADLTEQLSFAVEYGDYNAGDPGSPAPRTRTRLMLMYKL